MPFLLLPRLLHGDDGLRPLLPRGGGGGGGGHDQVHGGNVVLVLKDTN